MFCGMGNCTLSVDGQPYCICNDPCLIANETGTPCATMLNPCSAAAKRACNAGGDYGYCEPDESATTYITTPSMNAPFFNRNHDHDELFAPSSSIVRNKKV
ncbi:hypothetical protein WR25_15396 [Diploscapter pachys]|uniref:Uncharacterized protein n=1 Tax=Diploscapter pachys TaxID=2018661 RepID=A0A2A2LUA6_9BILA|nr:hypothetical protein WR25_15396 [Diploscapter pachys]